MLLALTLVINPVAVLASDFNFGNLRMNRTMEVTECDPAKHQENSGSQVHHDDEKCETSCCEGSDCTMQGICIIQHNTYFVATKTLRFNPSTEYHGRNAYVAAVPELDLPPEPPPPIHI